MVRTTVDIDDPVLREVKKLQRREGKSLGRLITELLAGALADRRSRRPVRPELKWISRPMRAKVELLDKEAVRAALDAPESEQGRG